MAQSVEQWMSIPATPTACEIPVAELPVLPVAALELDNSQRPERVTVDRWMAPDVNLITALFPK
jgi:hypothetical protein